MSTIASVASPGLARTLTIRLAVTTFLVLLLQSGIVSIRDYLTETDFLNGYVRREARLIARALETANMNAVELAMGQQPAQYYGGHASAYAFRVLDNDGRVIAGRNPETLESLSPWLAKPSPKEDFWLRKLDPVERMHVAGGTKVHGIGRDVWVELATFGDPESTYLRSIALDIVKDVWVPLLPLVLLSFLVTILSVRRSLRPLAAAADRADEMSVIAPGERFDVSKMPDEASQFAAAINRLLDRVADLVASQRMFIARAAHELRTPLSIMMLEIGHMKDVKAKALEADVRSMSAIVDQLLSLARLEATAKPMLGSVDVSTVVRELVGRMLSWAEQDGHSVEFASHRTAPILADETALREAVRNLIENAVKHTPPGTMIRVEVAKDGSVSVDDAGPGLPLDAEQSMTLPFHKGSAASAGAGLGLAIVKQAAELHGGRLRIGRSALGGASCRVSFEAAATDA